MIALSGLGKNVARLDGEAQRQFIDKGLQRGLKFLGVTPLLW